MLGKVSATLNSEFFKAMKTLKKTTKTKRSFLYLSALLVPFLWHGVQPATAEVPRVVASIKPIHSLVAGVMEGNGAPTLIIEGSASPHGHRLRPSDSVALNEAQLIFRVSPILETSIEKSLRNLAGETRIVTLEEVPGITRYHLRESATFEAHLHDDHEDEHSDKHGHDDHGDEHSDEHAHDDHGDEHHDEHAHDDHGDEHGDEDHDEHGHDEGHDEARDTHFWLDPENARTWLPVIADNLAAIDPQNAALYQSNAVRMDGALKALTDEVREIMSPIRERKFVVFHDAYRHFEERFGVEVVGAISLHPDQQISAKRLREIYALVESVQVSCIFSEPQFSAQLVEQIAAKEEIQIATLDPLGANLRDGPSLYFALIRSLAETMSDCLKTET